MSHFQTNVVEVSTSIWSLFSIFLFISTTACRNKEVGLRHGFISRFSSEFLLEEGEYIFYSSLDYVFGLCKWIRDFYHPRMSWSIFGRLYLNRPPSRYHASFFHLFENSGEKSKVSSKLTSAGNFWREFWKNLCCILIHRWNLSSNIQHVQPS